MTEPTTGTIPADPIVLLKACIAKANCSDRVFAAAVMGRDERTIRRWLSGETEIPKAAQLYLVQYYHREVVVTL